MKQFFAVFLAAAFVALVAFGGPVRPEGGLTQYNLDFEQSGSWYPYADGYALSFDVWQSHSGRQSLKVVGRDLPSERFAFFNQQLSADAAGREVRLTGWVRTEGVDDGLAGIWIGGHDRADWDPADPASPAVRGTSDWTCLDVRARLSDTAQLVVAAVLTGNGTAWFDDFSITIDGAPLTDPLLPVAKWKLTRAERRALRKYVHPLRTWEPDGGDTDDLAVLGALFGDASIVALGESTHGTREIFRMKDRLIRHLAEAEGFDIFSIEAGMPEGFAVNRYTVDGEGDAAHAVAGMKYWTWGTEAMRDLAEWMHRYNASQPRIAYTGFDMQFGKPACDVLRKAFEGDERVLGTLDELAAALDEGERARRAAYRSGNYDLAASDEIRRRTKRLLAQMEEHIAACSDELADACRVPAGGTGRAWLGQQVTLLRQFLAGGGDRDRYMADNLMWIGAQNPASRIVAWAHNGHINVYDDCMGGYLRERLGDRYRAVGFAFYQGTYTILGDNGPVSLPAQMPYPGTLEYVLEQLDEPVFILDLKRMREAGDPMLEWLDALTFRAVGSMPVGSDFITGQTDVSSAFDCLIFIRNTTASRVLSL